MKRVLFLVAVLSGFFAVAYAADLTSGVSTENSTKYNKGYRDVKDGTNALTFDSVTANDYETFPATLQNTVKASGGYLDSIIFNTPCVGSATTYVVADAAAGAASYATVIATIPAVNATSPLSVPYNIRFNNGLAINVTYSSCSYTVSYR